MDLTIQNILKLLYPETSTNNNTNINTISQNEQEPLITNNLTSPSIDFLNTNNLITPYNFVKNNFDFDICTTSFDFSNKKFLINYKKSNGFDSMRILDTYINKMTGSQTDSYSTYRANKTIERMRKYIERGFYIENWREFLIEIRDKMCKE